MEAVILDIALEIDYVLNQTGHKQLYYIGFSMGNSGIYALLSRKPGYNSKVSVFVIYNKLPAYCIYVYCYPSRLNCCYTSGEIHHFHGSRIEHALHEGHVT